MFGALSALVKTWLLAIRYAIGAPIRCPYYAPLLDTPIVSGCPELFQTPFSSFLGP
jgi:hypothetical protein